MEGTEIVVGSYDQVILGYSLITDRDAGHLEPSFTDNTHSGCVKCMAVSAKGILASGGTDETIRLLDIKKKKELGSLVHHNGTVTCIKFYKGFMFTASEDGCMCLWSTRNWECLRTFKGHKSGISSISIHPSGKLALSVGKDKTLRTWNLMTGKVAYVTNLKQEGDIVKWSPEGDMYAVVINNRIDIYCVETASVKRSIQAEGRIHCIDYFKNDVIVYAGEGSQFFIQNVNEEEPLYVREKSDLTRIKGLCITPSPIADKDHSKIITIGSSDGWVSSIKLMENDEGTVSTQVAYQINAKFRLTCMAVYCKSSKQTVTEADDIEETVGEIAEDADQTEMTDKTQKRKRKRKRKHGEGMEGEMERNVTDAKKLKKQTTQSSRGMETKSKKAKLQKKPAKAQKKKKSAVK